jgi:predicted PurR-regulated permease PerM
MPKLAAVSPEAAEEAEILHASIKAGTLAQIVVAVVAVLALLYLLKLVIVTTLAAVLLAFVLEPLVGWLALTKIPRALGAFMAVAVMLGLAAGLSYFSYNSAVDG